jgi:bacterioferritin-associated ferredoxin
MSECKCQEQQDVNIVCRCEDITLEEIRAYINQGVTDLEMLKRLLRVGMGPCQGRTCTPIIVREIAIATGQRVEDITLNTFRPPTTPVKLGVLAGGEDDD